MRKEIARTFQYTIQSRGVEYSGIIPIRGGNVHGFLNFCWLATGLLHYYVREFSTLLNVIGDANSCMCKNNLRNPRTLPPTNNDDSIVHHTVFVAYIQKLTISTKVQIF